MSNLDATSAQTLGSLGLRDELESVEVRENLDLGGRCLVALVPFGRGAVIARFDASDRVKRPTRLTVQRDEDEHLELSPAFLQVVNHSCEPNVFFDVDRFELVALRPIAPGDHLEYFYPSTEWSMAAPFDCACGSTRCLRRITGAAELPPEALREHVLSAFIRRRAGL